MKNKNCADAVTYILLGVGLGVLFELILRTAGCTSMV